MIKTNVLYVAFHYPPVMGSSGVHRSLVNTRYLSENGHSVAVLTSSVNAYDHVADDQAALIPKGVNAIRAWAVSTPKTLSFKGKYLSWMAIPDNWQSWIIGGMVAGIWRCLTKKPEVIVSTYPIASAHVIAYTLSRLFSIPWIADLRDPMSQNGYPADPKKKRVFDWLEKKIVRHASACVLTTQGAIKLYQQRFPQLPARFWRLVPNGFDETIFAEVEQERRLSQPPNRDIFVLLHSGVIYPSERDPRALFRAIKELKQAGKISSNNFRLDLRATGHDAQYAVMLGELGISDIVKLLPLQPFKKAVEEMYEASALLLMQADNCDYQIPAKAYEYIRLGKPILSLSTPSSDTGQLMQETGQAKACSLTDVEGIKTHIMALMESNGSPLPQVDINRYSRQHQAKRFAEIIKQVVDNPSEYR